MNEWSDRRPENLEKPEGSSTSRLTKEDRACGFHLGQSALNAHKQAVYSDAVRPSYVFNRAVAAAEKSL